MTIKEKILNYFTINPSLKVLFIFDSMAALQSEIAEDATEWGDVVYHKFAGDWFTTKMRLANEWADKRLVLLFPPEYSEPSTDQEVCRKFPLLGILQANMVFREDDEKAFMDQHKIPEDFSNFVSHHIHELLRDKYHSILSPYYGTSAFSLDLAQRGIISAYLDSKSLLDWHQIIARLIILCDTNPTKAETFFNRLLNGTGKTKPTDTLREFNNYLITLCGRSFDPNNVNRMHCVAEALMYNAITQNLATDKNDPYKEMKIEGIVRLQAINTFLGKIADSPKLHKDFLPAFNHLAANIHEEELIRLYGADADYGYWTEDLCKHITAFAVKNSIKSDPDYVVARLSSLRRYLDAESALRLKIDFSVAVANYYTERNKIGSLRLNSPDLYVQLYTSQFYLLDRNYRNVIATFTRLGDNNVTAGVEQLRKEVDVDYATITNELNLEWLACLKDFGKGLKSVALTTQNVFYKANIEPLKNKVVVIVSDALRYELATELMERINTRKHNASVVPALAMLPTETKYCKPSLLPNDSLAFADNDLLVDGRVLSNTALRTSQLQRWNDKAVCIDYKEFMGLSKAEKREIIKNQIIYIFHNTLDDAGHDCTAKTFTSACKDTLDELYELVIFMHDTGTVTNVFVTADHGFLYNNQKFEEKDKQKVEEDTLENKSRYYITMSGNDVPGITKFKLSDVSAMNEELYVAVPLGTNRLAAPAGGYEFTHGGASLQELITPVLFSKYKRENEKEKVGVELNETTLNIVSSRMKVHLIQKEAVDTDRLERTVICGIYSDSNAISEEHTVTLNSADIDPSKRSTELTFNVPLSSSRGLLKFKVFDTSDMLNPLISQNVINNTLIEQDDF